MSVYDNDTEVDEAGLFKSASEAYSQDVVPRARGIRPPSAEDIPASISPTTKIKFDPLPGDSFKFDLFAAKPAPTADGATATTGKSESFKFNLFPNEPAAPAPEPKKLGFLESTGKAIDDTITKIAGSNKPKESQIDKLGLAEFKIQEAQDRVLVAQRRAELGTGKDRNYGMQLFDSAAADLGNAVSSVLGFIGEKTGSSALSSLAEAGKREADALRPEQQDLLQKIAGVGGSLVAFAVPGAGIAGGLRLLGAGIGAARTAGAGTAALLESASIGQETFEKALSETGNRQLANEQAWKAAAINLPINWFTNKIGIFTDKGNAARQIGMTMLAEGSEEGAQTLLTNTLGFKPVGEGFSESAAIGAIAGGALKGGSVALEKYFKEATPEQQEVLVKSLIEDGQQARQKIFDEMVKDERTAQAFAAQGIESAADPRFQEAAIRIVKLNRQLSEIEAVDAKTRDATTKTRQADVQAAFGDTASTSVGVGTGADTPVIQRESVAVGDDGKSLVAADEKGEQPAKLPDGTIAMSGEDIVANEQGFKVLPAFTTADGVRGNTFVTTKMAETFLYGPFDKTTNKRSGGWADLQDGSAVYQIRQGQRSKANGGGKFYFIESKKADAAIPATNSAGFVPEPASQVQAQISAVKDGRKKAVVTGKEEAAQVDAGNLTSTVITDKSSGAQSVVISKDPAVGTQAQQRTDEVGLKQAMGETLGVVNPTATSSPQADEVVVQQKDNKTGEVIAEEAVAPESVAQVVKVPETTTTITTPEAAVTRRTQPTPAPAPTPAPVGKQTVEKKLKDKQKQKKADAAKPAEPAKAVKPVTSETFILTPDGEKLPAVWQVVEADSIQAALKEGKAQPRDRSRATSNLQIAEIANKPDFERLSDTSKTMDYGAPTISKDGVIIGGNGRFEGVSRAYDAGNANDYKADLIAKAPELGLDPEQIATLKAPVLVRRLTQEVDIRKLAIQSNQSAGIELSDMEQAALDAERMKGLDQITVGENGTISMSGDNSQNIRRALGDYTTNELGAFITSGGELAQSGLRRIRNAILYRAYGKSETLARLIESPDADLKNVGTALVRAAAKISGVRDAIAAGQIDPQYDITTEIQEAIELLSDIRANGQRVDEYMAQEAMFADVSDATKKILVILSDNIRSAKAITKFLTDYADYIGSVKDAGAVDMFGEVKLPTKNEVIDNAARPLREASAATAKQADERASETRAKDGQQPENRGSNTGSAGKAEKVAPKQTVEAKLKAARKAKKAETEIKPKPEPAAKADKPPKAKAKTEAKAESEPKVKTATQAATKPEPAQSVRQDAIENWEDNDGGDGLHIAFKDLPKEVQADWLAAYAPEDGAKPYASAALHDEYVARARNNERKERINAKVADNKAKDTPIDGVFRVSGGKRGGMTVDRVRNIFDQAVKGWTNVPKVNIVATEKDLPAELQQDINRANAQGFVPGIFYNGEVYLVSSSMVDAKDVVLTVTHEIAGHYGLRSILGRGYADVMQGIYNGNAYVRGLADKMMAKEGLDQNTAVEEVLADLAENDAADLSDAKQGKSALAEIYSAIRKWLRENFNIAYATDAEVKQIVKAARRYVVDGEARAVEVQALNNVAMRVNGTPTFYSALERAFLNPRIQLDKNGATSGAQWKGWLGKTKDGNYIPNVAGVKAEEVEWVGINDWFDLNADTKITKEQVLLWVAGNRVKVNEVVLSERSAAGQSLPTEITAPDVETMRDDLREQYEIMEADGTLDTTAFDFVSPEDMDTDQLRAALTERLSWTGYMYQHRRRVEQFQRGRVGKQAPKYEHARWTLKGGKDYAEIVLYDPTLLQYKSEDDTHFGDITFGKTIGWIRANVRQDKNGNDVLFIEELQSQREQEMRKGMSVPPTPFAKNDRSWTSLLLKRAVAYAQEQGIDRLAWTTGQQQTERYMSSADEIAYVKNKATGKVTLTAMYKGKDILTREVSADEVGLFVDPAVAELIASGKDAMLDNDIETSGVIGGDGLRLARANLRPYYDQTIPSVTKEFLKKFDGKTEVMEIDGIGQQLGFVIPAKLQQAVAEDGLPMFRRKDYEDQFKDVSPRVRDMAVAKGFYSPPTIKERLDALKPKFWLRVVQGTFDQFRSVKDLGLKEYMLLRMSSGGQSGGLTTLLHFGQVFDDGGALNVKPNTEGLLDILKPVGIETDRFLLWIAANRAGELSKQDRELFFSPEEITELKKLNAGSLPGGGSREAVYAKTLQKMNSLNKSVLDVALSTGLIDKAGYDKFVADIWYVPFYRQMEADNTLGAAQTATGAVGQYLSKNLKGSKRQLNDLMENVLLNWNHILSASMKNQAAVATLNTASDLGQIVTKLDKQEKGAVKVMEQGKETFYRIDDEFLLASLESVASIPTYGPIIQAGRYAKTMLTRFISLSPTFKVNNLIRDSIQSIAVSGLKKNPVANVIEGWAAYRDNRAEALAGGGLFAMGNAFDGDQNAVVKRLLKTGASADSVLTTTEKAKAWITKAQLKYDEISDSLENSSRIALYQQMRQSGSSHLEASFAARDLQDFSLQGTFSAIRYANLLLPYFNARLQGLYKLGHDGLDPVVSVLSGKGTSTQRQKAGKFAAVLGAVTLVELVLYLSQMDDDEWKKREEWDKDAFWWFKFPGTDKAIRIPKPFEMGAFATIVGRATEQMVDKDVEGKLFAKRLGAVLHDNLAINPMPQIFRPLYDLAKNKDGFTDRPIESMGMERLSPELRINQGTSAAAVGLSKVNSLIASAADTLTGGAIKKEQAQFSPIQYDYLVRGYLGWVGTAVQTSANLAVQPFKEGSSSRFERIDDYLLVGNYLKTVPASQSKYVTSFYENAKASATAVSDMQHFINAGQIDRAREVFEKEGDKIALSKLYTKSSTRMADISKQMRAVEDDKQMSGSDKRQELERLSQIRVEYAKRVEEVRQARRN